MNSRQDAVCRAAESSVRCARRLKPDHPQVRPAADRLDEAVRNARALALKQAAARDARSLPQNSVEHAKKILYQQHLVPVATDGLQLVSLENVEALRVPPLKAPAKEHLAAAARVREIAARHQPMFIDQNYPPDFLERFDVAVEDLRRATAGGKNAAIAAYTDATREVRTAVEEVHRCLDSLDARMNAACFGDRKLSGEWRKGSRTPGKIGRPKKRRGRKKPRDDGTDA